MKVMQEDQTNLIMLVALLVSTAGFKEQLISVRLGTSNFTLFDAFLIATIAFGCLLYIHLLINSFLLLLKALKDKKKRIYLIILRLLSVLILVIIPMSAVYISSSNWLTTEICTEGVYSDDFLLSSEPKAQKVCQTPLLSTVLPLFISLGVTIPLFAFVNKRERDYKNLSAEQKNIMMQIQEYRLFQATSSNLERINYLQSEIDRLEKQYRSLPKVKE